MSILQLIIISRMGLGLHVVTYILECYLVKTDFCTEIMLKDKNRQVHNQETNKGHEPSTFIMEIKVD